jgi:hypothetical protein
MRRCQRCGEAWAPGDPRCPACGFTSAISEELPDVIVAPAPPPVTVTHVAVQPRPPWGLWLLAVSLLLAPPAARAFVRAVLFFVPVTAAGQTKLVFVAFGVVAAALYTYGRFPCWAVACYVGWLLWRRRRPSLAHSA